MRLACSLAVLAAFGCVDPPENPFRSVQPDIGLQVVDVFPGPGEKLWVVNGIPAEAESWAILNLDPTDSSYQIHMRLYAEPILAGYGDIGSQAAIGVLGQNESGGYEVNGFVFDKDAPDIPTELEVSVDLQDGEVPVYVGAGRLKSPFELDVVLVTDRAFYVACVANLGSAECSQSFDERVDTSLSVADVTIARRGLKTGSLVLVGSDASAPAVVYEAGPPTGTWSSTSLPIANSSIDAVAAADLFSDCEGQELLVADSNDPGANPGVTAYSLPSCTSRSETFMESRQISHLLTASDGEVTDIAYLAGNELVYKQVLSTAIPAANQLIVPSVSSRTPAGESEYLTLDSDISRLCGVSSELKVVCYDSLGGELIPVEYP